MFHKWVIMACPDLKTDKEDHFIIMIQGSVAFNIVTTIN